MKYPKRSQYKCAKSPYRIGNWPEYEAGLRRRTEGFLRSLADMLEADIPIPDHTTLARWLKTLGEIPFRALGNYRPIHLLIDSTGLRIHVGNLRKPPEKQDLAEAAPRGRRGHRRDRCLRSDQSSNA